MNRYNGGKKNARFENKIKNKKERFVPIKTDVVASGC